MFKLRTPKLISQTNIWFDPVELEKGTCGLFRAPLDQALGHLDFGDTWEQLIESVPVDDPSQYEIDIKVHMLMPGQYPCIPNWHTDMVPRDESGLRFDLIDPKAPPMLLWISDGPETEFLARDVKMPRVPGSHQEIAHWIRHADARMSRQGYEWSPDYPKQSIQPNCWWSMDQQTPHRGTQAKGHGWRVFARVTHKSLAPARPVHSVIRRHAQVYLDARDFSW